MADLRETENDGNQGKSAWSRAISLDYKDERPVISEGRIGCIIVDKISRIVQKQRTSHALDALGQMRRMAVNDVEPVKCGIAMIIAYFGCVWRS
jgi:hypothetical protein